MRLPAAIEESFLKMLAQWFLKMSKIMTLVDTTPDLVWAALGTELINYIFSDKEHGGVKRRFSLSPELTSSIVPFIQISDVLLVPFGGNTAVIVKNGENFSAASKQKITTDVTAQLNNNFSGPQNLVPSELFDEACTLALPSILKEQDASAPAESLEDFIDTHLTSCVTDCFPLLIDEKLTKEMLELPEVKSDLLLLTTLLLEVLKNFTSKFPEKNSVFTQFLHLNFPVYLPGDKTFDLLNAFSTKRLLRFFRRELWLLSELTFKEEYRDKISLFPPQVQKFIQQSVSVRNSVFAFLTADAASNWRMGHDDQGAYAYCRAAAQDTLEKTRQAALHQPGFFNVRIVTDKKEGESVLVLREKKH